MLRWRSEAVFNQLEAVRGGYKYRILTVVDLRVEQAGKVVY